MGDVKFTQTEMTAILEGILTYGGILFSLFSFRCEKILERKQGMERNLHGC